jgi:hypothetical protein
MTDPTTTPPPDPARPFDFWLGDWDVAWGDDQRGRNRIEAILDGAVILEQFDGTPGTPLRGMSVSVYHAPSGQWRQAWVDNQGGYWAFTGGFAEGCMVLATDDAARGPDDGRPVRLRMVWHNITPDALDWRWERSDDGGQTWKTLWQLRYTRRGPGGST